jgi:hypothetical protein
VGTCSGEVRSMLTPSKLRQLLRWRRRKRHGRGARTYEEEARQESIILGTYEAVPPDGEEPAKERRWMESKVAHVYRDEEILKRVVEDLKKGVPAAEVLAKADLNLLSDRALEVLKRSIAEWRRW